MPEVEYELRSQIDRAKNAGILLTHLDTHMAGMVSSGELFGVYRKLHDEYKLPILLEPSGTHGSPAGISVTAEEATRSEEHTSELQSHSDLVCRLLLGKKKKNELSADRGTEHVRSAGH